jgi:hypothetical protein
MYIWTLWDGDGERERHTHTYIHTYIHACMHIYIILRRILYMYLSIYLSINPFIYLPFYLHMFHVSTCTLSAHRGSCRAWWISTTACAPGRTQSPSDTLLGARATWTATSHLAMCSRGCRWNRCWWGWLWRSKAMLRALPRGWGSVLEILLVDCVLAPMLLIDLSTKYIQYNLRGFVIV